MINILTIDLEDWFQVYNFSKKIKFKDWDKQKSRIISNTNKLLKIMEQNKTKATFFCLGWVGEKYPALIEQIQSEGHEIASHGYSHKLVYQMSMSEFITDIKKSKLILEKITNEKIKGFRAPSFSITKSSIWALSILKKLHFKYDSSIFPIIHPDYGIPDAKPYPHFTKNRLIEIPPSTIRFFNKTIPVAGGGYLRCYPYSFTRNAVKKINKKYPAVVYLHPWEIDPNIPRKRLPLTKYIRNYTNLRTTEAKLKKLLKDFKFAPIKEVMAID